MKPDEKRQNRINILYLKALNKKYTSDGKFHYNEMVMDAMKIGVSKPTAINYSNKVLERLYNGGHLK